MPGLVPGIGGLADTNIDANDMPVAAGVATGIQFTPVSDGGLGRAIRRGRSLFHDKPAWQQMQKNGMATDVEVADYH